MNKNPAENNKAPKKSTRRTTVAAATIAVAVAIVVFLNLIVSELPSSVLEFDISSKKLYTVSDTAKEYIEGLDTDVELILVAESGTVDERISKFVYNYAALSDHITVSEVDPVKTPSVLTTYDTSADNLVVYCPESGKTQSIPFEGESDCIIQYALNYSTYSYAESAFDADGQITSAIDYVTGEASNTIYLLSGHGESSLPTNFSDLIDKSNIAISSDTVDLLLDGGVPEDCDLLVCYAPTSDLSADEVTMLSEYMQSGGDFYLVIDEHTLSNFNSLLYEYGMEMQAGYIGDTSRYYQQYYNYYGYFCIAPVISSYSDITSSISTNAITLSAHGLVLTSPERDSVTLESFLGTSSSGFLYYDDGSYTEGISFTLGAVATEELDDGSESRFTVITSANLLNDDITGSFSSMANLTIGLNALTANLSNISSISIPAKSLSVTHNSISGYQIWGILFIGLIPVGLIVFGLIVWLRRRKR